VGLIENVKTHVPGTDNEVVNKKMQHLIGRLDELEKQRRQDSQTEILMFVGTGLFLLVSFELMRRR
jgi:prefoldin subunit 5